MVQGLLCHLCSNPSVRLFGRIHTQCNLHSSTACKPHEGISLLCFHKEPIQMIGKCHLLDNQCHYRCNAWSASAMWCPASMKPALVCLWPKGRVIPALEKGVCQGFSYHFSPDHFQPSFFRCGSKQHFVFITEPSAPNLPLFSPRSSWRTTHSIVHLVVILSAATVVGLF